MMKEIKENMAVDESIAPLLRTTDVNGSSVDMQNYGGAMVVFHSQATIVDGTHTPALEESDDDSTFTAVATADLSGSLSAFTSTAEGVQRIGYNGNKRYLRAVIATTGSPETGALIGAIILRGFPRKAPVS